MSDQSLSPSPEYDAWRDLLAQSRLRAGVPVCPQWREDFPAFALAVGARPSPDHVLDRRDPSREHGPGNTLWVPVAERIRAAVLRAHADKRRRGRA